jgi:hypothetical protein
MFAMDVLWILVLVPLVGLPVAVAMALFRGALAAGLSRRTATAVATATVAGWGIWIVTSGLLARSGVYAQNEAALNPWIPVALLGSLGVALLLTRLPVLARILADPGTPARLAVPQTLRAVGVVFLVAMAMGQLPAVFALPAGLGDIAVGLAAPVVAWRLTRGTGRRGAVWFNILGITDLVVAVGIGVLAGLGPDQVIPANPSTAAVAELPMVLIPTTLVPLALALHIVSLRRLRSAPTAAPTPALATTRLP